MKTIHNTYKKRGVNVASADKLVNYISKISKKTHKKHRIKIFQIYRYLSRFI